METKSSYRKRKDLKFAPYTNGVKNQDGEEVIRPLNEDELEFLAKFDKEFVDASFNNDSSDLHYKMIKDNAKEVKRLKKAVKQVSAEVRKVDNGYREMNGEERIKYKEYRKELFIKKNELVAQLEKVNIKGSIEANNYSRSTDVSNSLRTTTIGDLSSGNFVLRDGNFTDLKNASESELFDKLKNPAIIEE